MEIGDVAEQSFGGVFSLRVQVRLVCGLRCGQIPTLYAARGNRKAGESCKGNGMPFNGCDSVQCRAQMKTSMEASDMI